MDLRITFLGTSGSIPTPKRNLPAVAIKRAGELFLFDCGEGTQRQMFSAKVGFKPKMYVFISHMHLDHISGLFGLIHTLNLLNHKGILQIFGPEGLSDFIGSAVKMAKLEPSSPLRVEVKEVADGLVHRGKDYSIYAASIDHTVPCFAYALVEDERPGRFYPDRAKELGVPEGPLWSRLQKGLSVSLPDGRVVKPEDVCGPKRPGRKVVYCSDTRPIRSIVRLAEGADVLIHEATFDDEMEGKALEGGHSTPSRVAELAKEAGVKRLILTHISARYEDPNVLLHQAKRIFPAVEVAEDFMEVEVPLLG